MRSARFPLGWLVAGSLACVLNGAVAGAWLGGLLPRSEIPQWAVPVGAALAAGVGLPTILVLSRQARTAARAEARFRAILEEALDGIMAVDGWGRIVAVSRRTEQLFGYGANELLNQPVETVLPQRTGDLDSQQCGMDAPNLPPNATDGLGEFAGRRKDGSKVSLEVRVRPPRPDEREPLTTLVLWNVTKSKQTRETLRTREAHLRLVLEQMPALLWTTDERLQITSSLGAGLADLRPEAILDTKSIEARDPDELESTPVAVHAKALRGTSQSYEMEWKGRTFQVRVEPLRSAAKQITGTIGIVLDITDRKQTLAELKARVRQQAAVAALGQRALAGTKPDQLMNEAATMVARTLGVEYCEVLESLRDGEAFRFRAGFGWAVEPGELFSSTSGSGAQAAYTLRAGHTVIADDLSAEERFRKTKLVQRGAASGLSTIIQGQPRPFGVLGVHTTRKRQFTEDDLYFLQAVANILAEALERKRGEEAQERLVAILEATTDLVAIAGTDQRLLYLNQAGRRLVGLGLEEPVGERSLAELYAGDSRRLLLNEGIPTALRAGVWSGETALQDREEQEIAVSQVILAHKAPGGAVNFLSTIARDIRERQRLEEQFRQAQKMEAVGRLAGGVAHDFNNLLTVITGCSVLLLEKSFPPETQSLVEEIQKAGERAAALTQQLLAFSRKQMLKPSVLNLNALVTDMDKMLCRLIGEDIELILNREPTLHPVKADPMQVQQIVLNLAVNARDAMPKGGRLTLATGNAVLGDDYARSHPELQAGAYVYLAVSDTGCGMDRETLGHLFEPFFTTKEVGKGTGLGLATVFGIVKQSGGHIEVVSAPDEGTTFTVYLPRIEEWLAAGDTVVEGKRAAPRGTETVLLVEDEEGVRALAREVLRRNGYNLLEAEHGEEALAVSAQHAGPIHLLLTDVVMPRLGGHALAEQFIARHPGAKVLYVSGFSDSALVRHGIINGERECLCKPFTPDGLVRAVRAVLDGQPLSSQAESDSMYCNGPLPLAGRWRGR